MCILEIKLRLSQQFYLLNSLGAYRLGLSACFCTWILFIYFFLWVCVCSTCAGSYRDQKKTSDPLELEFQLVVSHHVGAGD